MKSCKNYGRVSVQQFSMATGKRTLGNPARLKEMAAKIARSISNFPEQDPILIFTFKGDNNEMSGKVRREVAEHGINLDATLDKGGPRIRWLTWGNETSISEYQHCKHIILAGVLRRSPLDLLASAAGREDDLCYRLAAQELKDVQLSEAAHCVLQAMNRGSCRRVDEEGMAHAMSLTILADVKGLHEALADSLPGIEWEVVANEKLVTGRLTTQVRDHLQAQPMDRQKVSIRSIKASIGVRADRDTWRNAVTMGVVLTGRPDRSRAWRQDGQSVVRRTD